jgi:hypothetical protein
MKSQRTFVPHLEVLEHRYVPTLFLGGNAVLVGSVLNVSASNPANFVAIFEDGKGDVAVSWNGAPVQVFNGVSNIQVSANGFANALVFIDMAPLAAPAQLNVNLTGIVNIFLEHAAAFGAPLTVQENPPVPTLHF